MSEEDLIEDLEEELETLVEEEEAPDEQAQPAQIAAEALMVVLMRQATDKLWPGDPVMADFVQHVLPPLSEQLGHVAAKGGEFAAQHRAEGRIGVERYSADQTMRAHLLNGLLPTLHFSRLLQAWGAPQFRAYDDTARRVSIAGNVMHDFLKLPDVENELQEAGFSHERAVGAAQMPTLERIFLAWCERLGLDAFLKPVGGAAHVLHDLIYIACNTQVRWGTLRNLSLLKALRLNPAQLDLAEQLSRLADLLAYVVQTPPQAMTQKVQEAIKTLSDGRARLTYHHVADIRGVLTNFIHNAALRAMTHEYRQPLLYAPSGVIYLEHTTQAPPPPPCGQVAQAIIDNIKVLMRQRLAQSKTGFKRDSRGVIKFPKYYRLFFNLPDFLMLSAEVIPTLIPESKSPSAGKRFEKMKSGQWMSPEVDLNLPDDVPDGKAEPLPLDQSPEVDLNLPDDVPDGKAEPLPLDQSPEVDLNLPNDIRVDQLAEWCYLAEKQVREEMLDFDAADFLLREMGLADQKDAFLAVPRDNRAGGVGYHWYFAAGHFIKRNPGLSPAELADKISLWAKRLADAVRPLLTQDAPKESDAWADLKDYIAQNLTLGGSDKADLRRAAEAELKRYINAKRKNSRYSVCSLCSSPYQIEEQLEAAVLFMTQVYTGKKPLGGSDAVRDICSICSLEMMLRQILMNRSAITGKGFEGRRIRYLFFYPLYFFTPETLQVLRRAYLRLRRVSVTDLKRQLSAKGALDLSPATLQRLQAFMLDPEDPAPEDDHYIRLHFPESDPVMFAFLGVPPPSGQKATDVEAWVHPALLALLLPLMIDVKVVASESLLPVMLEANEIDETVFLDAPHAAIQHIVQKARLNVDELLPAIRRLMVTYAIHVDANAASAGGFDYRWQQLPPVARNLAASPIYAFHYLKKGKRQEKSDNLTVRDAMLYLQYVHFLSGDQTMTNHARTLTQLYRRFYRAKRWNSNSILQPITKTARVILDADARLFADEDALTDAAYGALHNFIERAYKEQLAFPPKGSTRESQQAAMQEFARYFVHEIFFGVFRGDRSALRGKQLNLLKNACEVIYLDEAAKDRAEREEAETTES